MTTLSTPVSSLVVASPPSDVFHKTSEPVEIYSQAAGINAVTAEIIAALGHVDLVTAGATTPVAGHKGELISGAVLVANTVSLTTATPANLVTLALTAGDWLVTGSLTHILAGATCTVLAGGTSLTTATLDLDQYTHKAAPLTTTASQTRSVAIPTRHIQLAAPASLFLVSHAVFSAGTVTSHGSLSARRIS
jgi:hypothetical protein